MPKTVYCISCSVGWKIACWSELPDIPDNASRKTRKRRRRAQAIAKRYAFHANAKIGTRLVFLRIINKDV